MGLSDSRIRRTHRSGGTDLWQLSQFRWRGFGSRVVGNSCNYRVDGSALQHTSSQRGHSDTFNSAQTDAHHGVFPCRADVQSSGTTGDLRMERGSYLVAW